MGVLTHEHPLLKEKKESAHVDSFGTPFGSDDHIKIVDEFDWSKGVPVTDERTGEMSERVSPPIEHKHRNIEESFAEGTKAIVWTFKPPSKAEAEKPIGVSTKPAVNDVRVSKEISDDELFDAEDE